jgi:hypothetical protein
MSAIGTKRTFQSLRSGMSAFGGKADVIRPPNAVTVIGRDAVPILIAGAAGKQLFRQQNDAGFRPVGRGVARMLSFLLVHGLAESVRGLGTSNRGKLGAWKVLRGFKPYVQGWVVALLIILTRRMMTMHLRKSNEHSHPACNTRPVHTDLLNSDFPHGSYSMIPSILVPPLSCLELLRINSHHLD